MPYRLVLRRQAAGLERRDRGTRPVDVIDAPAPEPGTVLLLLAEQPAHAGRLRVVVAVLVPERLERMCGDVGARLVGYLDEIAGGQLVDPARRAVDVARPPAAAAGLHPEHPVEAPLDRRIAEPELP